MKRVAILVALVVVAALLWVALGPSTAPAEEAAQPAPLDATPAPGVARITEPQDLEHGTRQQTRSPDRSTGAATSEPGPTPAWIGELRNAAGGDWPRTGVEVLLLRGEQRVRAEFDSENANAWVSELAGGEWRLEIRAAGFHELQTTVRIDPGASSTERYKLWPADWILVRALTAKGEPYGALATELGHTSAHVFEEGFRVWRSETPPQDVDRAPTLEPLRSGPQASLASPHYEKRRMDPREVARVRRGAGPTTWIALAFHERFCGWAEVPASVGAVEFELALEDVTRQFGSLAFCVVDAHSEAPLLDARATLDAEVSGLRRPDVTSLAGNAIGCFLAEPLLPGEYDLAVSAPGRTAYQERVTVRAGARVDLGEVALDFAAPLEIRVLDADGAPAPALVQVGAWRDGAWIEDCVTPRAAAPSSDGHISLPMPATKSVFRAQPLRTDGLGPTPIDPRPQAAAYGLFDPATRAQRIELVLPSVLHEVELLLPSHLTPPLRVQLLTDFEIAFLRLSAQNGRSVSTSLAPGAYRARILDALGEERARCEFSVPSSRPTAPIELR